MRVLVCDDHQLLTEALASVLRRRGDTVVVTGSPEEAVRAAEREPLDVCLIDRGFRSADGAGDGRGDDGIAAAQRMREVAPQMRVVMLTAHTDAAGVRAALAAGVRGFLRKDDGLRTILGAVDEVMAGTLMVERGLLRRCPVPGGPPLSPLTPREQEVLERVVRGQSTHAMAGDMGISYSTARTHTHAMMTKLGVQSRLQAAAFAVEHGLVPQLGVTGMPATVRGA